MPSKYVDFWFGDLATLKCNHLVLILSIWCLEMCLHSKHPPHCVLGQNTVLPGRFWLTKCWVYKDLMQEFYQRGDSLSKDTSLETNQVTWSKLILQSFFFFFKSVSVLCDYIIEFNICTSAYLWRKCKVSDGIRENCFLYTAEIYLEQYYSETQKCKCASTLKYKSALSREGVVEA